MRRVSVLPNNHVRKMMGLHRSKLLIGGAAFLGVATALIVFANKSSPAIGLRDGNYSEPVLGRASEKNTTESFVSSDRKLDTSMAAEVTGSINPLVGFLLPTDSSIYGLNTIENGLFLADGLTARMIAVAGHPVPFADGLKSNTPFHERPDGAAIFEDPRPNNPGGWIYVSNSEIPNDKGGVGAITFDSNGDAIAYERLLSDTTTNCNGGKTHFGAWISCEEDFVEQNGKAWQVDPTGERPPQPISLGSDGGTFEAFAYDVRDTSQPRFFLTEDSRKGPVRRWTPSNPDFSNPWELLLGTGNTDYLMLIPDPSNPSIGKFTWTTNIDQGRDNAEDNYPNNEGIDVSGNTLFFVSKVTKFMFELNLDEMTYVRASTETGL